MYEFRNYEYNNIRDWPFALFITEKHDGGIAFKFLTYWLMELNKSNVRNVWPSFVNIWIIVAEKSQMAFLLVFPVFQSIHSGMLNVLERDPSFCSINITSDYNLTAAAKGAIHDKDLSYPSWDSSKQKRDLLFMNYMFKPDLWWWFNYICNVFIDVLKSTLLNRRHFSCYQPLIPVLIIDNAICCSTPTSVTRRNNFIVQNNKHNPTSCIMYM